MHFIYENPCNDLPKTQPDVNRKWSRCAQCAEGHLKQMFWKYAVHDAGLLNANFQYFTQERKVMIDI